MSKVPLFRVFNTYSDPTGQIKTKNTQIGPTVVSALILTIGVLLSRFLVIFQLFQISIDGGTILPYFLLILQGAAGTSLGESLSFSLLFSSSHPLPITLPIVFLFLFFPPFTHSLFSLFLPFLLPFLLSFLLFHCSLLHFS